VIPSRPDAATVAVAKVVARPNLRSVFVGNSIDDPRPYLGSICHKVFALALSPHRAFEMKSNQYLEKFVIVFILSQLSHPASATTRNLLIRAATAANEPWEKIRCGRARAGVCRNWQDTPVSFTLMEGLIQPNLDFGHKGRGRPWESLSAYPRPLGAPEVRPSPPGYLR
jgi:hypothetical protein